MVNYSSTARPTQLAAALSASATTMIVSSATGYPSTPFKVVIDSDTTSEEVVLVTNRNGTTFTITRGQDNTPALPHSVNAVVRHGVFGSDLQAAADHAAASTGVHGLGGNDGAVVGAAKAQTLSNKTISGSSNTFSNIPQAAISNVSGGNIVTTTRSQTITNKTIDAEDNSLQKPYLLRAGSTTDQFLNADAIGFTTMANGSVRGDWSTSGSGHSSQFSPPVSGIYRITATVMMRRTNAAQNGMWHLQFRQGVTAGTPNSGSVQKVVSAGIQAQDTSATLTFLRALSSGTNYGITVSNQTSNTLHFDFTSSRCWIDVEWVAPS